jgi:hypothetical protein
MQTDTNNALTKALCVLILVAAIAAYFVAVGDHVEPYKPDICHITDADGVTILIICKGKVAYIADK